ncbi:1-acyl-sn-glycerol-3-phosphate acyltransferase [Candidatus Saccharibacteria bacterium]|nr:1-acyl-sn-glycerol-3-phosphate acyltransferase [Candidatus Saccharibacteria bacterium]
MKPLSLQKRVWLVTRLMRMVLSTLNALMIFVHVSVRNREMVPKKGAVLVVFNHESTFDPIALFGALPRNVAFLAAGGLFRSKLSGFFMRWMGQIPVPRGTDAAAQALLAAEVVISFDGVVALAPEGATFDRLHAAKTGAARLAFKTGVLVVPAGLIGMKKIKPRGKFPRLLFRRAKIVFGEGFYAPRITDSPTPAELDAFNVLMMNCLADLSEQPRLAA